MKKLSCILLLLFGLACAENQLSHTQTSQKVVESFYTKDNDELKKYTTEESYESFLAVQELFSSEDTRAPGFRLIRDTIIGDTAWVLFSSKYEEQPETFMLIKENGRWKVTERGIGERSPF